MGDDVAVDDVVVPVSLAQLQGRASEPKVSPPRSRFGGPGILGEGELVLVVIPRTKQVDGPDVG